MQWLADRGPVPQHVGALLLFDRQAASSSGHTVDDVYNAVCARLAAVPALHRRPHRAPLGCGGWVWLAVPTATREHVRIEYVQIDRDVDRDGGNDDLAKIGNLAASLVTRRFAPHTAPWAAYVLAGRDPAGLATGARADPVPLGVVVAVHHVLADGMAGMALLARLVDGLPPGSGLPPSAAQPLPSRRELLADAWSRRAAALRALPGRRKEFRAAWAEMGRGGAMTAAPRSSLNRPTGPRRDVAVIEVDLTTMRSAAHARGATVNDALLACVAAALGRLQAARGEDLEQVVVSVPVAARQEVAAGEVGNAVGALPLPVPTRGPLADRLSAVTAARRARLATDRPHGASQPLILAAFGVLSALHLVQWYATHQRLVNTLVTTVRGPGRPVRMLGLPVSRLLPVVVNQGNVTVSFSAMTYAGTLCVVVTTDPDAGLGAHEVAEGLRGELAAFGQPTDR